MVDASVVARQAVDLSADAGEFLRLLGEPTRRRIFFQLMQGETCNCEMSGLLGLAHT